MQHTYEDRIAALRADIDRLTSRQLLNQREVEARVDELTSRQGTLSERQSMITGLTEAARAAGLAPPAPAPVAPVPAPAPKPTIKSSALVLPSMIDTAEAKPGDVPGWQPPLARMAEVEAALDRMALAQASYVDQFATTVVKRNVELTAILKTIGRAAPLPKSEAVDAGGPYVPLAAAADPSQFKSSVDLVSAEIARYAAIRKFAAGLPLAVPVPDPQITSGFGTRIDPFLGTPAVHTGIDYRAYEGQPIAATAPGTVIAAETGYNGGYGNMVDIDHGNGVVTRFGHLSAIDVRVGQVVAKGTIIGRAGSTGRATGPHLHYELRVNDEAIDPTGYITAGEKLLPLL
jgi:murein DD-endopeptidase MepM/ murein hydrolase activator NlpD